MRRRVTFSRNVTLSLSRTCASHCKYCAFATHRPHLHDPEEVLALLDGAARRRVKELLVLTGEQPDVHAGVGRAWPSSVSPTSSPTSVWACERALERGLLPTRTSARSAATTWPGCARSRRRRGYGRVAAYRPGRHQGSPTKDPALRLQTIRDAGELRIPFTSGILVGIGETPADRSPPSRRSPPCTPSTATCRRSSCRTSSRTAGTNGEEPAQIASAAAEDFWRTGLHAGPDFPRPSGPRR
jgi:FO synthase